MITLSWTDVENIADELAQKIKASEFVPDYIVGVARGGLIPLYFLAKQLGVRQILTVSARHYGKDGTPGDVSVTYLPDVGLHNKRVLLVDEMADSGGTLKEVSEAMLAKYDGIHLKTATIALDKTKSILPPDFYVIEEDGDQIVFPWDPWEPLPRKDTSTEFSLKMRQLRGESLARARGA